VSESIRFVNLRRGQGSLVELIERMAQEGFTLQDQNPMPIVIDGVRYDRFAFVPVSGLATDARAGGAPV
jgi:hypothetical protein